MFLLSLINPQSPTLQCDECQVSTGNNRALLSWIMPDNESSSKPFYRIIESNNLVRLSAPQSRVLRTTMTGLRCWSSPRCSTPRPPTCWPRATSTWRTCWTAGATAGPAWVWGLTPASWALATPPAQGRSGAAASATPPTCCSSPSWAIRGSSMVRCPGGNHSLKTHYV